MQIPIEQIRIKEGRRSLDSGYVKELAASIREMGLLNPITIDRENVLIAGLHRMEAAKMLGWTEIPCTVSSLEGLAAELAEIDENIVRSDISALEYGEILLRRKEIYETLHPETKNGGDRRSGKTRSAKCTSDPAKSFVDDTAEKLGVDPSTIRRQIQTAKNLTPETKEAIKDANITKADALKLSRLAPEHQAEAAKQLVSGDIHSVDEYQPPSPTVPYSASGKHFDSIEESIADLKNPDKDCSYTPDLLLAELDSFINKFHKEFAWYSDPFCTVVFPEISSVQLDYLKIRFGTISTAIHDLLKEMKRSIKNELQKKAHLDSARADG